jgi:hypothetical protein
MQQDPPSTEEVLSDLLLNQCITKKELSKIVNTSIYQINKALSHDATRYLKEKQLGKLFRLYERLKRYEHNIEEYLHTSMPSHYINHR